MQSWDSSWVEEAPSIGAPEKITVVFPVFIRKQLQNSEVRYSESLMYIASSEELARQWCVGNTDLETKKDAERCWWFAITQEAIDGAFTGVGGLVCLLDWEAKDLDYQPLKGYEKVEENKDEESKVV